MEDFFPETKRAHGDYGSDFYSNANDDNDSDSGSKVMTIAMLPKIMMELRVRLILKVNYLLI